MQLQNTIVKSEGRNSRHRNPQLQDVKWLLEDSIYVKEIETYVLNDQYHFHSVYEIALIIKSKGTRIIGDSIENFTDGDLVLLGPHVPHIAYVKDDSVSSSLFQALVVYFHPDWLSERLLTSDKLSNLRKLLEDTKRGIKFSGATKEKLTESIIELKNYSGLKIIIKLLEILEVACHSKEYECLASEGYSSVFNRKDIQKLNDVYQYIRDHFTEPIMLEDIAAVAYMTPTAFCKFFKNKTQKTFSNFVNEVRIGYACKLLINEDLTVSQICYECGFNNLTSFNTNFKRFKAMSPSEYKMKIRSN
jgi:AraC-like DNA-binding protein